eukprot:TRINITY_DN75389_c0_g1_i1.p1 TRINITY_DN75389_c0_g1~~TRINITY_DN75389_c0_g1_i1.p1  ORF type:complete len:279 (+),score=38.36 TRINITY_DN75389_c0_g1_i1:78-914(+)
MTRTISGTVTFDVRGHYSKVLPELIQSRPDTLLAQLLDDVGTDSSEPIFVDANPDRFANILDWYRYGCMFLPSGASVDALLHDAAFFLLPEEVTVNGVDRPTIHAHRGRHRAPGGATHAIRAEHLQHKLDTVLLRQWPEFDAVLREKLRHIEGQLLRLAQVTGEESRARNDSLNRHGGNFGLGPEFGTLETSATIPVTWRSEGVGGICSMERLRLLSRRLQVAGYSCNLQEGTADSGYTVLEITIPTEVSSGCLRTCTRRPIKLKSVSSGAGDDLVRM